MPQTDDDIRDYPDLSEAYDLGYEALVDEDAPAGLDEAETVAFYQGKEDRAELRADAAWHRYRDQER